MMSVDRPPATTDPGRATTDGATATLCYGYNGGNCTGATIPAGGWRAENLTPINSIRLNRP